MGTEVLRPQAFFYDGYRLSPPAFHRRKTSFANGNGFGNQRPSNNSGYRKPVHRQERSDQKKKTQQIPQSQKPEQPQQLHLPRISSSSAPPPPPPPKPEQQQQQQLHHPRRSSSAPPPPNPQPLFPRRSSSANEFQNNLPRVTILRRGQSLDTIDATRMKRDLSIKTREELVNKKCMDEDDVYAGSAFFVSPSPSSLPLPSFFNTNNSYNNTVMNTKMNSNITIINQDKFHDSATRDLRRLLRLE